MRIALLVGAIALAGCSTTPEYNYQSQYCYTDQRIERSNNNVDSTTVLECTDRPSRQTQIQRAGIDAGCKEFWYNEYRNGQRVPTRGVVCEKFNGSLEIVNINGNVR
jgi:hypothetical protein